MYEVPEDFAEFWGEATAEAYAVPLDLARSYRADYPSDTHFVEELEFRGVDGKPRHGWIAVPREVEQSPGAQTGGFLWIAPYGRWSMRPNSYGTRAGMVSLSFNFHGESAFHEEDYRPERGYFAEGIELPRTWILRWMYQDTVIAARLLAAQAEVAEGEVGAMGMSQGGGMALWLGAWCPAVRAVCADMPFLANVGATLTGGAVRYPMREVREAMDAMPLGEARVLDTLSYYDTVFHAAHCPVPTQVSLGLRDPASRPPNVRDVYDALPGPKRLIEYPGGHDWDPEMVPSNAEWLEREFRSPSPRTRGEGERS